MKELRVELRNRGIKVSGIKDDLVDRLRKHDKNPELPSLPPKIKTLPSTPSKRSHRETRRVGDADAEDHHTQREKVRKIGDRRSARLKEKVKADVKEEIHRDAENVLGKKIKDTGGIESRGIQKIAK